MRLRKLPLRVVTGAFILHSGLDKWHGDEATAEAVHGMAAGTYPAVRSVSPSRILRVLAVGEIATGAV